MHIAFDTRNSDFEVTIEGRPSTREELLDWDLHSRIGIIVDGPYGGLDASTLLFLAGTAFYDANPKRRMRTLYPNMYLFHVGAKWGSHMPFDFFPIRKEVVIAPDACEILLALNQTGITHLLIPDRKTETVKHRFKESEEALDRIKKVFVYGRDGQVDRADVSISASRICAIVPSIRNTLNPRAFIEMVEAMITDNTTSSREAGLRTVDPDEMRLILPSQRVRVAEVPDDDPSRIRLLARINVAEAEGRMTEQFRRETVKNALMMLC